MDEWNQKGGGREGRRGDDCGGSVQQWEKDTNRLLETTKTGFPMVHSGGEELSQGQIETWSETTSDILESGREALEVDDQNSLRAREESEAARLEGIQCLLDNLESKENKKREGTQVREDDKVDKEQIAGVEIENTRSKEMIRIGETIFSWLEVEEALNSLHIELIPKQKGINDMGGGGRGVDG
ncbi:hypothetical protein TorRG33x02_182630 [Trema orientale]|uniref:Uncharacterized protein n=1 Tax=Trema orientale TaxID=63057 RepID=A0A2P5EKC9_TREOI|nr:hypothetical protein TorRG33x02_182630 [Trema orientale]